jgi:hypothetical protein
MMVLACLRHFWALALLRDCFLKLAPHKHFDACPSVGKGDHYARASPAHLPP